MKGYERTIVYHENEEPKYMEIGWKPVKRRRRRVNAEILMTITSYGAMAAGIAIQASGIFPLIPSIVLTITLYGWVGFYAIVKTYVWGW